MIQRVIKHTALMLMIATSAFAAPMYDFNSGTGTVLNGWTWSNDADGYGASGWRKDDGAFQSGGTSNWMPRIHAKEDYGTDILAIIDTINRAPNTSTGGSLKVYDSGDETTYQACWWWIHDTSLGTQAEADGNTNRMSFYFKPTGISVDPEMTNSNIQNANIHIGTYLCWDGGGLGGEDCPTEADGHHYYHYLTVNDDAWLHVQLDRHPTHKRGQSGADEPNDDPAYASDSKHYYENMDTWYIEIREAQAAETAYWVDEIEFWTQTQTENEISIASVWVGYWEGSDKWEIGFNDNSFNAEGYNNDSVSTFEIRYSTSPITNANYSSATVAEPEYHEYNTTNQIRRPNSWKKPAWTRFTIPDSIEEDNDTIYFAIKDVSLTANGDGHDAPSSYIKTIDYVLRGTSEGAGSPIGGNSQFQLGGNSTITFK